MKHDIRGWTSPRPLNEKLFDIQDDVEYIYDKSGVGKFITELWKYIIKNKELSLTGGDKDAANKLSGTKFTVISSKELRTRDSVRAHRNIPIKIITDIGIRSEAYYSPLDRKVSITLNGLLINDSVTEDYDYMKKYLKALTPEHIKKTISHEVSHWVDDAVHGKHLTGTIQDWDRIQKQYGDAKVVSYQTQKYPDINMHPFEINAQLHAFKSIYNAYGPEKWESLSFIELLEAAGYRHMLARFKNDLGENWLRRFLKQLLPRLHREKLLTRRMIDTVKHAIDQL